ncbi:MAG: hypothetical protein J7L80_03525, partial [Thermoplasmata archaeon]|nr:hypothetical protein [Thermoplasmata archaeon]
IGPGLWHIPSPPFDGILPRALIFPKFLLAEILASSISFIYYFAYLGKAIGVEDGTAQQTKKRFISIFAKKKG